MGWILKLLETYENCKSLVGQTGVDETEIPLLPIAHSTQNAQIEAVINGNSEFLRAKIVDKGEDVTIIPVTEDSATRTSGISPHPLCDKLQYVAGDYAYYTDGKKGNEYFEKYIEQLESWCLSPYQNNKVNVIYHYLKKGTLVSDLIKVNVLTLDSNGKLNEEKKIGTINQSDAFIRFRVEIPDDNEPRIWMDKQIYDSFINYYLSSQKDVDLCYVTGKYIPYSEKHPSKIRNSGDKGKLISANDCYGFTYRGRFTKENQVVTVGYETSQKAHNILRWLIEQQGYRNNDQVILAWGTKKENIPKLLYDTEDTFFQDDIDSFVSTEKEYAIRLKNAIAGYGQELDTKSEIIIMGLDSATVGRLAVNYYREMNGWDFLNRIETWHRTCSWRHTYKIIADEKKQSKRTVFIGAPSPKDIVFAAYGDKAGDKLKKATIERILPCIVDGARFPYDLVKSAVNRVSNPVAMERWEWEKTLTITCALIKKFKFDMFKEEWDMALDENQKDRSYLFGRLLAITQQIEEWALNNAGEKRETNAERFMHQFKLHPYKTWGLLTDKLRPYIARLGGKANNLIELMTKVTTMLSFEDFTSSKELKDSYILGYYCQRQIFIDEKYRRIDESNKKKLENNYEGDYDNE